MRVHDTETVQSSGWWESPRIPGSASGPDDVSGADDAGESATWTQARPLSDDRHPAPLPERFGQVRSRSRVRDLAEVFTAQREVDAMLDMVADAFDDLDAKFLEPSCGSGNFLVEILRRKLVQVTASQCTSQEHFEHRLLRALASIYGVDISPENVVESRARLAQMLIDHYQSETQADPTPGFLDSAELILDANVIEFDMLTDAADVELCDWRPAAQASFQRVWSPALVPRSERDLFWAERIEDPEPVHYSQLLGKLGK